MEIKINNAESSVLPESGELLGHFFMRLDDHFNQIEHSVLSVAIDGTDLNAEQQEVLSHEPVSTYDSIEISTVETRMLPLKNLEELKPIIENIPEVSESIAVNLQSGNITEAMGQIDSLLQVWAILFQTITDSAKLLTFNLSDVKVADSDVQILTSELSNHLMEMQEGLQNRDYVTVADIVEYEISPAIDKWMPAMESLITFISQKLSDEPTG